MLIPPKTTADSAKLIADSATNTATSAATLANTANNTANNATNLANTAKNTADTAKTSADSSRITAETAKTTADSSRITAETAKSTADNSKVVADGAKLTADNSKVVADGAKLTADIAKSAIGNRGKASLSLKPESAGPQFEDGSRWLWDATGIPNGGTIVAAFQAGTWKRESIEHTNVRWFNAVGNGTISDTVAIQKAIDSLGPNGGEVYFPAGVYLIDGIGLKIINRNGITFKGESRYGSQFVNGVIDNHMIVIDGSSMIGFDSFEWFQSAKKNFGAYCKVTNCSIIFASRLRIQNPYGGFHFIDVGGMHFHDVKFLPQNIDWPWASAIYIEKSAGFLGSNIDINFGQNDVIDAAIVLDGGCDTIYFSQSIANQIGGNPGGPKGGTALRLVNRNGSFNPRWVRFNNVAFESSSSDSIIIEKGNNVEFSTCYAVNSKNGISIVDVYNFKWLGGVVAACSQHGINIAGGKNITIDNSTVAGCSLQVTNTYSGIFIDVNAKDVTVGGTHFGDEETLENTYAQKMAYGIAIANTSEDRRHIIKSDNRFGPQANERIYNGSPTSTVQTRRITEGYAPPTVGSWNTRDEVVNLAPAIEGTAGNLSYIESWVFIGNAWHPQRKFID